MDPFAADRGTHVAGCIPGQGVRGVDPGRSAAARDEMVALGATAVTLGDAATQARGACVAPPKIPPASS